MISLLHPTVRPDKWQAACQTWFENCDYPSNVEYILVPEKARFPEAFSPEIPFGGYVVSWNTQPATLVGGYNCAARLSTGDVIVVMADDVAPSPHWDTLILDLLGDKISEPAVLWASSGVSDLDVGTIMHPIVTRAYFNRFVGGFFFYPEYHDVYADTELGDIAFRDRVVIDVRDKLQITHTRVGSDDTYALHDSHGERVRKFYLQRKDANFPITTRFLPIDKTRIIKQQVAGKVNIIIPLYNYEEYIAQCVHSALNQTYRNFDVTVVNDGSTDHSLAIVQELFDDYTARSGHDNRLKIISQENKGLSESRNAGIRSGDGEFILPLDSDDWIDPNYLELTVPKMADPKVGVVATDMQYEGLLHHRIPPAGFTLAREMQSNELPVCSLIRRSAFEQIKGGYETIFIEVAGSTRVLGYEDWNLYIDILKRGWKVVAVSEPLFHYLVKSGSMISQATKVHKGLVRLIHLLHPDLWQE